MNVYKFINKEEQIIYVGRAKDINNRLISHNHLPNECYKNTYRIYYYKLNSFEEMCNLELYLISTIKPKYNTQLKMQKCDDIILDETKWIEINKPNNFYSKGTNPSFRVMKYMEYYETTRNYFYKIDDEKIMINMYHLLFNNKEIEVSISTFESYYSDKFSMKYVKERDVYVLDSLEYKCRLPLDKCIITYLYNNEGGFIYLCFNQSMDIRFKIPHLADFIRTSKYLFSTNSINLIDVDLYEGDLYYMPEQVEGLAINCLNEE